MEKKIIIGVLCISVILLSGCMYFDEPDPPMEGRRCLQYSDCLEVECPTGPSGDPGHAFCEGGSCVCEF